MLIRALILTMLLAGGCAAATGYELTAPAEARLPTVYEADGLRYVVDDAGDAVVLTAQNVTRGPVSLGPTARVVTPRDGLRSVAARELAAGETLTLRLPPEGARSRREVPELSEIGPADAGGLIVGERGGVTLQERDGIGWDWPVDGSVGIELPWTLPDGSERVDRLTLQKVVVR